MDSSKTKTNEYQYGFPQIGYFKDYNSAVTEANKINNQASAPTPQGTNQPNPQATPQANPTGEIDQKLGSLGITQDQLQQLNSPQGMDPTSFSSLLNGVQNTLKTNNVLASQRQLLMKHLFDSPLTPDELAKLPSDVQDIVKSGNKDNAELQLRVINDQLQDRKSVV